MVLRSVEDVAADDGRSTLWVQAFIYALLVGREIDLAGREMNTKSGLLNQCSCGLVSLYQEKQWLYSMLLCSLGRMAPNSE